MRAKSLKERERQVRVLDNRVWCVAKRKQEQKKKKKILYNDLKVQKSKEWKGEMIDESSWVGNNSREKTCVVDIKREKKKNLYSDWLKQW